MSRKAGTHCPPGIRLFKTPLLSATIKQMNQKLQQLLEELKTKQIDCKIVELNSPAMTVPDVVKFAKEPVNPEEIGKTIVIAHNDGFVGITLLGSDKIDFSKLRQMLPGARFATPEEVKEQTGIGIGAVCPLLLNGLSLWIDEEVMKLENIHLGSGDHLFGLELNPQDIAELLNAKIVKISKDRGED